MCSTYPMIGEVRGKGLLMGVELVKNRETKEPARLEASQLRDEGRRRGPILSTGAGWLGNSIRINPPLVITEEEPDRGLEILETSLRTVCGWSGVLCCMTGHFWLHVSVRGGGFLAWAWMNGCCSLRESYSATAFGC